MKEERAVILRKLMHKQFLSFNELWGKEGTSNSFAYHLKVLEEDGFIKKTESGYCLTHAGKKYAAYVEGESGTQAKFPLVGVIVVIIKDDKVLLMKRTKEPFYGYWGFVGGKLKFTQYILECAAQEVKEETGLECDLELKGLFSSKTYNKKELSYNHQMFIIKGSNPRGELLRKTREGECAWVNVSEVSKLNIFPNVLHSIDMAQSEGFRWLEADRHQENDEFTSMDVLKNITKH